jgi:plasmid replication initiation protein
MYPKPFEDLHKHIIFAPEVSESFKARVVKEIFEPAVKELREKDGWLIDWTPIKTGRKVTTLRFEFKRDPQGRLL